MAAVYTKFSLEDIERFLKRGWRALRPRQGTQREIYYDLKLSSKAFIRVWSSIYPGQTEVRGKERRPMRVQLLSGAVLSKGRPLTRGKAPIVKRTQNWRNSLQNRIEDYIELFENGYEKYHDEEEPASSRRPPTRAPAPPPEPEPEPTPEQEEPPKGDKPQRPRYSGPPPTDKQIRFLWVLKRNAGPEWPDFAEMFNLPNRPSDDEIRETLSRKQMSALIQKLIDAGHSRRYASIDEWGPPPKQRETPTYDYNRQGGRKLLEVEPGYWADAEARFVIERAAGTFRVADMQGDFRNELPSLDEALKVLSEHVGSPVSV